MTLLQCRNCIGACILFATIFHGTRAENSTLVLPSLSLDSSPHLFRHQDLPPPDLHYQSTAPLSRKYSLEDFLWTGSGDGPTPSDSDGGLAWEDSGPIGDPNEIIRITKTMVLFRTVLTTIYPIEMTPTVVLSSVSPTPKLSTPSFGVSSSVSLQYPYDSEYSESVHPTHPNGQSSRSPTVVQPNNEKTKPTSTQTTSHFDATIEPKAFNASGVSGEEDPQYWVQTVIKANNSMITSKPSFQGTMQKNLALVYASAFKRHLMSSLGVLKHRQGHNHENNQNLEATWRQKRTETESYGSSEREDLDPDWLNFIQHLPPSKMRSLAMTTMNVTVTILNITEIEKLQHVSLNYIVSAEGNPIPATSAVHELQLVSKDEMEKEIGYEVINKAEALIASPLQDSKNEAVASPWLIVSMIVIIFLILSILIIAILIWKWKQNRLSSALPVNQLERDQSQIEIGVINPAFVGPPVPTDGPELPYGAPPCPSAYCRMSSSSHKELDESQKTFIVERNYHREQQKALASELNTLLMNKAGFSQFSTKTGSSSSIDASDVPGDELECDIPKIHGEKSRGQQQTTPKRSRTFSQPKKPKRRESSAGRRRKNSISVEMEGGSSASDNISGQNDEVEIQIRKKPDDFKSQFPGRLKIPSLDEHLEETTARGIDKISYDDLEVCQEVMARPMSAKARKLLPNKALQEGITDKSVSSGFPFKVESLPVSQGDSIQARGALHKEVPETIDEISDLLTDNEGNKSIHEQDRDWSESVEHIDSTPAEPSTRDAQVQTPKRMRPKPKPRRHKVKQLSSESLVSTESEEILEVHQIDSFSEEANPMGRMRKRFHQFLDDAFNVIGKREGDDETGRSKSAKVSISHHVETRETSRPWTSHNPREDAHHRLRPKSASFGQPKRAWGSHPERRCYSSKSDSSSFRGRVHSGENLTIFERGDESEPEESDLTSSIVTDHPVETRRHPCLGMASSQSDQCSQPSSFPGYPPLPYSDPPVLVSEVRQEESVTDRRPTDPAVPLILALREEIQRFADPDNPSSSKC